MLIWGFPTGIISAYSQYTYESSLYNGSPQSLDGWETQSERPGLFTHWDLSIYFVRTHAHGAHTHAQAHKYRLLMQGHRMLLYTILLYYFSWFFSVSHLASKHKNGGRSSWWGDTFLGHMSVQCLLPAWPITLPEEKKLVHSQFSCRVIQAKPQDSVSSRHSWTG